MTLSISKLAIFYRVSKELNLKIPVSGLDLFIGMNLSSLLEQLINIKNINITVQFDRNNVIIRDKASSLSLELKFQWSRLYKVRVIYYNSCKYSQKANGCNLVPININGLTLSISCYDNVFTYKLDMATVDKPYYTARVNDIVNEEYNKIEQQRVRLLKLMLINLMPRGVNEMSIYDSKYIHKIENIYYDEAFEKQSVERVSRFKLAKFTEVVRLAKQSDDDNLKLILVIGPYLGTEDIKDTIKKFKSALPISSELMNLGIVKSNLGYLQLNLDSDAVSNLKLQEVKEIMQLIDNFNKLKLKLIKSQEAYKVSIELESDYIRQNGFSGKFERFTELNSLDWDNLYNIDELKGV